MTLPTISAADTYHAARANSAWAALTTDNKTAALYRAQDYILAMYQFDAGVTEDHALVQKATIMLAAEKLQVESLTSSTASIRKESVEADGAGKTSYEYADVPGDPYPLVTATLRPVLASAPGAAVRCVRLVL